MNNIEVTLKVNKGWVTASALAMMTGVNERALRGEDSPLSNCAISGDRGYLHVLHATDSEFDHFYGRIRKHALQELIRIRKVRRYRENLRQGQLKLEWA